MLPSRIDEELKRIQYMIYEMFQFNTEDERPGKLCYVCFSLLQKCRRFSDLAFTSDRALRDLLRVGTKVGG